MAALIIKVMPESPETDLSKIEVLARTKLTEKGALNISVETQEIAFGLKALFFKFAWPEAQDTGIAEQVLSDIPQTASITIEDYRRAFG